MSRRYPGDMLKGHLSISFCLFSEMFTYVLLFCSSTVILSSRKVSASMSFSLLCFSKNCAGLHVSNWKIFLHLSMAWRCGSYSCCHILWELSLQSQICASDIKILASDAAEHNWAACHINNFGTIHDNSCYPQWLGHKHQTSVSTFSFNFVAKCPVLLKPHILLTDLAKLQHHYYLGSIPFTVIGHSHSSMAWLSGLTCSPDCNYQSHPEDWEVVVQIPLPAVMSGVFSGFPSDIQRCNAHTCP